nr:venom peptide [Acharia stimulea]
MNKILCLMLIFLIIATVYSENIEDLEKIGRTEAEHVALLQSSLAQGGVQPVQPQESEELFSEK